MEKNVLFGVMKVKNGIHDYFNHRDGNGDDHDGKVMLTNDHGRFCDAHLDKGVRDGTAVSCRNVLFAIFYEILFLIIYTIQEIAFITWWMTKVCVSCSQDTCCRGRNVISVC